MQTVQIYKPEVCEIMPSKRAYLYRAGYKGGLASLDTVMREIVNSIYILGLELVDAELYFVIVPLGELPETIIPALLQESRLIALFVSTLGKRIDERIADYLAKDQVLHASLLDAWASEALEALNHSFDARMRSQYGKGTRRFSPGYGDLDIRKNAQVLDLLQVHSVYANHDTGILLPRKSSVCMIGFLGTD